MKPLARERLVVQPRGLATRRRPQLAQQRRSQPVALALDHRIEAILRAFGVKMVTVATSGREAFMKLHGISKVVDVVICDYSMNEGNGLQLLQIIRMGKVILKYTTSA